VHEISEEDEDGDAAAEAAAAPADSQQSLGSLADFIAEPSSQEMEHEGLAFHSDAEDDPLAVLRDRRPFQSFRHMGDAAAAAQPRQREPKPASASSQGAAAAAAAANGAPDMARLASVYDAVDPSFVAAVSGCRCWLTDVSLLHDAACSDALHAKLMKGYTYDKVVKRQGKVDELDKSEAGLMELTACVDYCTHILAQQLGLLWAGGAPTPGVQTAGSLMLPDPTAAGLVCVEVTMHDKPLELSIALLQLVLGHPANIRWRDMVVGRKLYQNSQLIFLVQGKVRYQQACQGCSRKQCVANAQVLTCARECLRTCAASQIRVAVVACCVHRQGVRHRLRCAVAVGRLESA